MICLGSSPAVGSSRIRTFGSETSALREADPLPISFGQVFDQPVLHIGDLDAFHDIQYVRPAFVARNAFEFTNEF